MLKSIRYESDEDDDISGHCGYVTNGGKTDRKKRRGVIEKRRRDRINGSLSELKRLVPQAFEKQGSTKLEKAEILQMTVEHIRHLNSKGMTGIGADPGTMAMDYRGIGFRECAAEVARYLATIEGMDFNEPLRLRLLGHLEAYNSQRDAAIKANIQGLSWNNPLPWSGAIHGNGTTFSSHSKLGYSFGSSKASLNQLGCIGATSQTAPIDSAYLAASRLGSTAIGLAGHHVTTASTLTQLPAAHQPMGSGHYSVTHQSQPMSTRLVTSAAQYGPSLHAHSYIKHFSDPKQVGSEFSY